MRQCIQHAASHTKEQVHHPASSSKRASCNAPWWVFSLLVSRHCLMTHHLAVFVGRRVGGPYSPAVHTFDAPSARSYFSFFSKSATSTNASASTAASTASTASTSASKPGGFMTYVKAGLESHVITIPGLKQPWNRTDNANQNLKSALLRLPAVYVLCPEDKMTRTKVGLGCERIES